MHICRILVLIYAYVVSNYQTLPNVNVYIHDFILNNQSIYISLSLRDFILVAIVSTNSFLYTYFHDSIYDYTYTYLELAWYVLMFLFKCPNSYSTGFNQGEYYALKSTLHLNALHVSSTYECLCITALSMNTITFIFYVAMLLLILCKVRYTKLSKSVESTAPSITYVAITFVWLIADSNDKEYCYLLIGCFYKVI